MSDQLNYLLDDHSWAKFCLSDQYERGILDNFIINRLKNVGNLHLSEKFVKQSGKNCFERSYWKKLTKQDRTPEMGAIFAASIIRAIIIYEARQNQNVFINNWNYFSHEFPQFAEINDREELTHLTRYCLAVKTLQRYLPGKNNKFLFMRVGSLLEGSGEVYKTGGSPSIFTSRRIHIYEKICGVEVTPRPNQKRRRIETDGEINAGTDYQRKKCTIIKQRDSIELDGTDLVDFLEFHGETSEESQNNSTCFIEDKGWIQQCKSNQSLPLDFFHSYDDVSLSDLAEVFRCIDPLPL